MRAQTQAIDMVPIGETPRPKGIQTTAGEERLTFGNTPRAVKWYAKSFSREHVIGNSDGGKKHYVSSKTIIYSKMECTRTNNGKASNH